MPGVLLHPQPCVRMEEAHKRSHHRSSRNIDIPCAMVLTVSFELSPETRHCCLRRLQSSPADLMPALGHQDHTTSPSALISLVWRNNRGHRIPLPTLVTIAKRPSRGGGTA